MPVLFDRDAETGMTTYFDYDPINDQAILTYEQDVSGFLDRMKMLRDDPAISAKGIKEEWWHYCSIPQVVEMQLLKKGLVLSNKDHFKAIMKEINTNYPYLKATDKWHR